MLSVDCTRDRENLLCCGLWGSGSDASDHAAQLWGQGCVISPRDPVTQPQGGEGKQCSSAFWGLVTSGRWRHLSMEEALRDSGCRSLLQ